MKPDEIKDFTRNRFKTHLENTGCDDIAFYMDNFDKVYEKEISININHLSRRKELSRTFLL